MGKIIKNKEGLVLATTHSLGYKTSSKVFLYSLYIIWPSLMLFWAPFSRKIYFRPNLGKKDPKWPQNKVFWVFWKILSLVFLGNNLKWKLILLLIIHHQSNIWQNGPNSCQPIKLQDSLRCNISEKKQVRKFIIGMQINIKVFLKLILSFWVCASRHAQSNQNKKYA